MDPDLCISKRGFFPQPFPKERKWGITNVQGYTPEFLPVTEEGFALCSLSFLARYNADDLHMDTTDRCIYLDLGTKTEMSNSVLAPFFAFHYRQQMEKGVPLRLILNIIKRLDYKI